MDRRELARGGETIALEPQVFDLLAYLVRHRDRVVSKDDLIAEVWGGRIVSESTLTSRISAARRAIGDSGERQGLIATVQRRGFRFTGTVQEAPPQTSPAGAGPSATVAIPPPGFTQQVRYCRTGDGARIAYAEVGEGPPVVKVANYMTHLEHDWQNPLWSPFYQALAARHRLIRYDARGNGLSDWDVEDISFEAFVVDLETVIDAMGIRKFALFGMSQGAAVSVAYAVRHPERVSHLVLYGGFARGRRKRGSREEVEKADALLTLIRHGWGRNDPVFRQAFTSLYIPGGTAEQIQWWTDLQRATASTENAVRIRQAVDEIDVIDLLPQVKAPTLVLHSHGDGVQPFDEGRRMAAGIPGARFVALEGSNPVILRGDPAWPRFFGEIETFLRS